MKYEVNGVFSMSAYGEVEANNEKEAREKFAKMFEKSIGTDLDWIEEVSCDAKLIHDYTFELEQVLFNCGYSQKVSSRPKLIAEGQLNEEFNNIELYSAKLSDGNYIVFMVIDKGLYIPCWQDNRFLRLEKEEDVTNGLNRVFETFWIDKRCEVSTFAINGVKLTIYNTKAKNISRTTLCNRIEYILKKVDKRALAVCHSTSDSLDLVDPFNEKVEYMAEYSSDFDEVPDILTKVESII